MSTKVMFRVCLLLVLFAAPLMLPASVGSQDLPPSTLSFNGDGYADLAIGVPGENRSTLFHAGAAHVLFGGAAGLAGSQFLHQDVTGVEDVSQPDDLFAITMTSGDFNGDGFGDVIAGVPWEDVAGVADAGALNVLYGAPGGFSGFGPFWNQNIPGVLSDLGTDEKFARDLAAGDFDGDGYSDLAVGVPWEDVDGAVDAGAVQVFYGGVAGLAAAGNQLWTQNQIPVAGPSEQGDEFGRAVATGDFNSDGYDDLAIGARLDDLPDRINVGNVVVLYGSAAGLTTAGSQLWDQNNPLITGEAQADDLFGDELAGGDLNGDGFDDLAVGIAHKDYPGIANAGAVLLIYGGSGGLRATGNQLLNQDVADVPDQVEPQDMFGQVLATGDLNRDGFEDLAVGVPLEDVESAAALDAGVVNVFYGSAGGLTGTGSQLWYQGLVELQEHPETNDNFGAAVVIGDLTGEGFADMAVGVPGEGYGEATRAGAVQVIYGSSGGLTTTGNQLWHQNQTGIDDQPETNDSFGSALAVVEVTGPAQRFRVFLPIVLRND